MATEGTRSAPRTALVADLGGTNARLDLADLATLQLSNPVSWRRAEFSSLQAVVERYLEGVAGRPTAAAVAVAGPVVGETIRLTNSPWSFKRDDVRSELKLDELL